MLKIVTDDAERDDLATSLDELVAEGARRMLIAGLETEVADYVARHQGLVDEAGHRLVVRNGRAAERSLVTGAGALKVQAPRVNDRREGHRFSSYILPRYARRSPKVADVLPVLYLRGLSTGTSPLHFRSSSVRMPGCQRRRSLVSSRRGPMSTQRSSPGTCLGRTLCMCGQTVSISGSGWRRTGCAVSLLLV